MKLESIKKVYRTNLNFRNRDALLISKSGRYCFSYIDEKSKEGSLLSEFKNSNSKLSFFRWLIKSKKMDNNDVSSICKVVTESKQEIIFSCRFNDFARMSMTRHFLACTRPDFVGRNSVLSCLINNQFAIIFFPDRSGKMKWRVIVKLVNDKNLLVFKSYGNISNDLIRKFLESLGFTVDFAERDICSEFNYNLVKLDNQ